MALRFEELRVLRAAEAVADGVWQHIARWDPFARDVVGGQLARAADSVGANIAEAYGRFHYGEKLQFLYYARGSLFETKYWLNRARARGLMPCAQAQDYAAQLTDLARQLNGFAADLKAQRQANRSQSRAVREATVEYVTSLDLPPTDPGSVPKTVRETSVKYMTEWVDDPSLPLFTEDDFTWFQTLSTT